MRLFLSSENVGNYPSEFVHLAAGKRLAYIANAKDEVSKIERDAKILEHKQQFESLGFDFTEIDLRLYFERKVSENILDQFEAVWLSGGNTFLLRTALALSGMDEILTHKVRNDTLAYGGSSAGSVITGPTLHGVEYGDDPDAVHRIYTTEPIWDGLNLINFVIVPHWKSTWFHEEALAMSRALKETGVNSVELSDGEVYLVRGEEHALLS